jgi:hypothetical protein
VPERNKVPDRRLGECPNEEEVADGFPVRRALPTDAPCEFVWAIRLKIGVKLN